ncbi:hypothetical protein FS842_000354 [Serendipita sp. 407]|nr:hypothetical protein FS842_000354 [Serendipita sp. 407]
MAGFISEKTYHGQEKIVISMDIGTTQTAVSYSHLIPQSKPTVTQWPGQAASSGAAKIRSLVGYENAVCKACGEEASEMLFEDRENVAIWFKLNLHPDSIKNASIPPPYGSNSNQSLRLEIPSLPEGVTINQVYRDFLNYLFRHTEEYFIERTPGGAAIWKRLRHTVEIVLAIPNGWDYEQQSILRKAIVEAGIVAPNDADTKIAFVTEGEASVHYSLAYSSVKSWLHKDNMFAVIDAGGSTVDSTLYACQATTPQMVLKEVCLSECVQAGGALVDAAARAMLKEKLKDSSFGDDANISAMVDGFESKVKRLFDGTQASNAVQFGGLRDNDKEHNIFKGRISLTAEEVAQTFGEVIAHVVDSILRLISERKVHFLLLVGGFGESPYLKKRLEAVFKPKGTTVITVEQPARKAAAEGATIWYINRTVVARALRYAYGTDVRHVYDPAKHASRHHKVIVAADGSMKVPDGFSTWATKGSILNDDYSYIADYNISWPADTQDGAQALGFTTVDVYAWDGDGEPIWLKDEYGNLMPGMRHLCTIYADLSRLSSSLRIIKGENKKKYYKISFSVAIRLGGTQLEARLQWHEGKKLCEGPVAIIPDILNQSQ